MDLHNILFWSLSFLMIVCALSVIISRDPVKSVLFLIATFFTISGHYILLNAQFLAVVNIIVYAGAIMVLFLFVIMLMNLNTDAEPQKSSLLQFAAMISGGAFFLILVAILRQSSLDNPEILVDTDGIGLIQNLGMLLFKEYVLPFEISSVLFLSTMVGAMVLGKRDDVRVKKVLNAN